MSPVPFAMCRTPAMLAFAGSLLLGLPAVNLAQGTPGLTIFSGVERKNELGYHLDFGGQRGGFDRYHLEIPARKLELAVGQFTITYPDHYDGKFDLDEIEVRVKTGRKYERWPVDEVEWDEENYVINIYPLEPVPAGYKVNLVFSNVKNPDFGGTYYFHCQILPPGDIPLLRYVGTWILSIG